MTSFQHREPKRTSTQPKLRSLKHSFKIREIRGTRSFGTRGKWGENKKGRPPPSSFLLSLYFPRVLNAKLLAALNFVWLVCFESPFYRTLEQDKQRGKWGIRVREMGGSDPLSPPLQSLKLIKFSSHRYCKMHLHSADAFVKRTRTAVLSHFVAHKRAISGHFKGFYF